MLCHAAYVAVAHVGDGGTAIQTAFLLHLAQDMLHRLALVLCQSQCLGHQLVAFDEFTGGKAQGEAGLLGVVLDEVHDAVQTAVYGTAMFSGAAKVLPCGLLLI